MRNAGRFVLLLTLAVVAVAACARNSEDAVATVNGSVIERSALNRQLQQQLAQYEAQGYEIQDEQRAMLEEQVLDQLIIRELVLQDGTARGIVPDDAAIQEMMLEIRSQFPDEETFNEVLEREGLTLEALEASIVEQMIVEEILEGDILVGVGVDEQTAREFYDANPDLFATGNEVRASHILIRTDGATADERAEARATLEGVLDRIEGGAAFAELAQEYSQDGTAERGGDLGFFGRGQMVGEFEQVAFDLEVGETSGIVETQFGYHIIRVTDRREAGATSFDEVRAQIQQFLGQDAQQVAIEAYIERLRENAEIEIML